MKPTIKTSTITSFLLGMNTRLADFKLRTKEGMFMRDIANCDITQGGALKRRAGRTLALAGNITSMWSDDSQAYCASGTGLFTLTVVASVLNAAVVTGAAVASGAPVSFAPSPLGGAFWTDGTSLANVAAGASTPLAPPRPTVQPDVTVGTGGALEAGRYGYCFTQIDNLGRESSATPLVQIEVAEGASISFNLTANPPAGYAVRTYLSMPNGMEVYQASTHWTSGGSTVTTTDVLGAACTTLGLANLPAGRFVRYNFGRVIVASGSMLYFSRPFAPGLYDPTTDFIPLPATITVVEVIDGEGMFVVADKTYWIAGDPGAAKLTSVSPLTAMLGSGCSRPENEDCYWMSPRGFVIGKSNGTVQMPQEANVSINATVSAACMHRTRDGRSELIGSLYGAATELSTEGSSYTSAAAPSTAAAGETWVLDLDSNSSRRYTNYDLTSYARIGGNYYGANASGVFLLDGDTDAGTDIAAWFDPGRQDFNSTLRKRMEAAYITAGSPKPMKVTITDDAGNAYDYETRRADPEVKQQRFDVGRGLDGVYLGFKFANTEGAQFEIAGYELMAVETTRRLG